MSLADQSQQWYPTSVQVTVLQARGLRTKGKNGTNDAYAIMQVAKEKYSTSVAEKTVAPLWKEEATFDLPLSHHGSTERCTLQVHIMHRALVGPDKLLGQAVINLLELNEDKSRNKTEWCKLLNKAGKSDKDRGEVLLDIQFTRNNMTASMFDLSGMDKPRSRLGKLKDKVRGKKKDQLSETASAIVPSSFTQVLTDSEEEGARDGEGEGGADNKEKKKKHKLKSLFSPKSNLQRNVSQSMSVLGPLPERSSSLSGSRSSGLNIDSSEGKKKFKFMTHKRSGSSDSKTSQGSLSLLSRAKQGSEQPSNLCINGSHVYNEERQPRRSRGGSNFSLASSGLGSMEDLHRAESANTSVASADSFRALKQQSPWAEEEDSSRAVPEEEQIEEEQVANSGMEVEEEEKRISQIEEKDTIQEQWEEGRLGEERVEEEKRRIEEEEGRERLRMEEERKVRQEKRVREEEEERERIAEERRRIEEEETIRMEEEMKQREEEEKRVREEEEERERITEERRRIEEEEIIRMEEERKRREEEEKRVREEEEETERIAEERRRIEGEETIRMAELERLRIEEERKRREEEEEENRVREERERVAEERNRIEEEETIRKVELERVRMEEESKRREEQERLWKEEEERDRLAEERRRQEEQEMRMVEEERRRRMEEDGLMKEEEERGRLAEENRRLEEQERRKIEEEDEIRREEERAKVERKQREEKEESVRKEKEDIERISEEKRAVEKEMRSEEEVRFRKQEQESIRMEEERAEEERKQREDEEEEEERFRKEEEEIEREAEEDRRQEEQGRLRKEEELQIRREEEERADRMGMEGEEKKSYAEEDGVTKKEEFRFRMGESEREIIQEVKKVKEEEREREEDTIRREMEMKALDEEACLMQENRLKREEEEGRMLTEEKERLGDISGEVLAKDEEQSQWFEGESSGENQMLECQEAWGLREDQSRNEQMDRKERGEKGRIRITDELHLGQNVEVAVESNAPSADLASTDPFDDLSSSDSFEETSSMAAGPHSKTAKVYAVKPSSSCLHPPQHFVPSSPFLQPFESETEPSQQMATYVMEKKRRAPLPPNKQQFPLEPAVSSTLNLAETKPSGLHPTSRAYSATPLVGNNIKEIISADGKDFVRDKGPAPQPPGKNDAQKPLQREQDASTVCQMDAQRTNKIKTSSIFPQRLVQMIAPLIRPTSTTMDVQEGTSQNSIHNFKQPVDIASITGGSTVATHNKGPAPCRPQSSSEAFAEPKRALSSADANPKATSESYEHNPVTSQVPVVIGSNPFEEDETEIPLTRPDEITASSNLENLDSYSHQNSPSIDQDMICNTKKKSSKTEHAPLPPAKKTPILSNQLVMNHGTESVSNGHDSVPGVVVPDNTVILPCAALSSSSHPKPLEISDTRGDDLSHIVAMSASSDQITLLSVNSLPSQAQVVVTKGIGEQAGGKWDVPASASRRPHPVKPMSPQEPQPASARQGTKGVPCDVEERIKMKEEPRLTGPYSQLTQEELISLVVKQQSQLSERDNKVGQLEKYIDALLVRVMEEQPSILMSMSSSA